MLTEFVVIQFRLKRNSGFQFVFVLFCLREEGGE